MKRDIFRPIRSRILIGAGRALAVSGLVALQFSACGPGLVETETNTSTSTSADQNTGLSSSGKPLIGYVENVPYQYTRDGQPEGLSLRLTREIFERLAQPVEFRSLPFSRALLLLEDGQVDVMFSLQDKPDRRRYALFSAEPLLKESISLFAKAGSPIRFQNQLAVLRNLRFGLVRDYSYGSRIDTAVATGLIKRPQYAGSLRQNLRKLAAGRLDVLVSDRYAAFHDLRDMDMRGEVRELPPVVQETPVYIAFSKKGRLLPLRNKVDQTLRAMKRDGTYARLVREFMGP